MRTVVAGGGRSGEKWADREGAAGNSVVMDMFYVFISV